MTGNEPGSESGIPDDGVPSTDAIQQEREHWDENKTVKERVYETALTLRDPTTVTEVAQRAQCASESARKHLLWFAEMGIVERVGDGQPARFRRNNAYFRWKRADDARRSLSPAELTDCLNHLVKRDQEYQDTYDVTDPDQVSAFNIADPGDHDTLETVWTDINDWLTIREDQLILEQARRMQRNESPVSA
jgi:predicted transcriptional regulator